jgi:NAD(P)-dependent dehydrogenase (short-subunit alcohol dehydrogenase family)
LPRTWLITGSSRGLGRALAEAALAAGENVVATARNPDQRQDLVKRYPQVSGQGDEQSPLNPMTQSLLEDPAARPWSASQWDVVAGGGVRSAISAA